MPLDYSNNSLGVNFLRVVYKFGCLQAGYLFIIRQTQNADFAAGETRLRQNMVFEILKDRTILSEKDNSEMKYEVKFTIDFILCTNIQIPEFTENMLTGMKKGGRGWLTKMKKVKKWKFDSLKAR